MNNPKTVTDCPLCLPQPDPPPPEPDPLTFVWRGIERPYSIPLTDSYKLRPRSAYLPPDHEPDRWAPPIPKPRDPASFIWRGKDRSPRTYQATRHGHLMQVTCHGTLTGWDILHNGAVVGNDQNQRYAQALADDYAKSLPRSPRRTKQRTGWHEVK